MSANKRKSKSQDSERPSKKQQTATSIRVEHVGGSETAKPIVASSPGVTFPDVRFRTFAKRNGAKSSILLHSSEHSALDHIAREDEDPIKNHVKSYVAVFDPESGELQVTEAKRLIIRSALRLANPTQAEDDEDVRPIPNYTSRAALTAAFGTKKSKKAVQSMAENRLLAQGAEDTDNPISVAMLASMDANDEFQTEVSLDDALRNKPLPTVDRKTSDIDKVYSLNALVIPGPASHTLDMMPISSWIANITAKEEIGTRSRFVSFRVGYLIKSLLSVPDAPNSKLKKPIQVLRYIQLLLDLHTYITHLPKRKQIPPVDKWPEATMSEDTPMSLMRPINNYFFPERTPHDHSITLLRTTILALALHIPPPLGFSSNELTTEPTDIALDMAIEASQVRKLYRELGCKVGPATEAELQKWGLVKLAKKKDADGKALPKPNFAKLKFPLEFPKLSRGGPTKRR